MFLGCSPCCGFCPTYNLQGFTTKPDWIANVFFDMSLRISISGFTDRFGNNVPAADTGTISADGWMFPTLTSPITTQFQELPMYDAAFPQITYTGDLDVTFGVSAIGLNSVLSIGIAASLAGNVPSFVPRYNTIHFVPCRIIQDEISPAVLGTQYGDYDLVIEHFDQRSGNSFASCGDITFTLNAGSVSVDESLLPLNNWIRDANNNAIVCHRFAGKTNRRQNVMDAATTLSATWFYEDLQLVDGSFASTFFDLTITQATALYGDGSESDLLPYWTDSLATFTS